MFTSLSSVNGWSFRFCDEQEDETGGREPKRVLMTSELVTPELATGGGRFEEAHCGILAGYFSQNLELNVHALSQKSIKESELPGLHPYVK